MNTKVLADKLKSNLMIQHFHAVFGSYSIQLVGGAVIDILEGREPKDYDFVGHNSHHERLLLEFGYRFAHETKTARTFKKDGVIVQFLSTNPSEFDFSISGCKFCTKSFDLNLDTDSFKNKVLIPNNFISKGRAANSLRRLPHWIRKGYSLPEPTYQSLLNVITKSNCKES